MDQRVSGSEFHIARPDTEKARVPNCVLIRWMTAALFVDDRSLPVSLASPQHKRQVRSKSATNTGK